MLITVYITNYNYESFIKESIDSVLNQTFQDFELLIIDDGSKDNSKNIIETYRDNPKIQIVYQQNLGLNATNNVAMKKAKGKYLMRLDADDFLEPSALGIMVSLLEADNDLGLVFPDYYYVDKYGNRTGQERRHHFDDEVTLYDQPAHGACTMIRLEFLQKLGGYDEDFSCQDGYDLWIKFISFHKVTNISRPLFSYRKHNSNLTNNENKILETRRRIKAKFVQKYLKCPNTLAVIPVRSNVINGVNWPLFVSESKSILQKKVETCLKTKNIDHVAISSADDEILEYCKNIFHTNKSVSVIKRSDLLAAHSVSLDETVIQALELLQKDFSFEAVLTVSLDYPFISSGSLDEAINTLVIFKSDSVISTVAENSTLYRHTGNSLRAILDQDRYTKYEREALYKVAGGLILCKVDGLVEKRKLIFGSLAHILIDSQSAFKVSNTFDLNLFQKYFI